MTRIKRDIAYGNLVPGMVFVRFPTVEYSPAATFIIIALDASSRSMVYAYTGWYAKTGIGINTWSASSDSSIAVSDVDVIVYPHVSIRLK